MINEQLVNLSNDFFQNSLDASPTSAIMRGHKAYFDKIEELTEEQNEVVETTGAGDAFNGGFAVALSEGKSALEAVKFGCATASISVTRPGTAPSMPARDEVEKLLVS